MVNGKIVVRAAFNQHWHNNYYRGPDPKTGRKGDIMPANEDQARRLTQSGQATYDFVGSPEKTEPKKIQTTPDFSSLPGGDILENHFDNINGVSFATDEELLAIDGIGEKTLYKIREYFD